MTTLLQTDHVHLARAIELAGGGRGRVSPNPLVGAVIVKDERDAVPFSFDSSFNYYPLSYERPGPEIVIYRLRKCAA